MDFTLRSGEVIKNFSVPLPFTGGPGDAKAVAIALSAIGSIPHLLDFPTVRAARWTRPATASLPSTPSVTGSRHRRPLHRRSRACSSPGSRFATWCAAKNCCLNPSCSQRRTRRSLLVVQLAFIAQLPPSISPGHPDALVLLLAVCRYRTHSPAVVVLMGFGTDAVMPASSHAFNCRPLKQPRSATACSLSWRITPPTFVPAWRKSRAWPP